jgi:hypothetical protein
MAHDPKLGDLVSAGLRRGLTPLGSILRNWLAKETEGTTSDGETTQAPQEEDEDPDGRAEDATAQGSEKAPERG